MSFAQDENHCSLVTSNNNSVDFCNKNGAVARNMGNQTEHDNDYHDHLVETESNCSMEDTVAKLEHALRRNFKAQTADDEEDETIWQIINAGTGILGLRMV